MLLSYALLPEPDIQDVADYIGDSLLQKAQQLMRSIVLPACISCRNG
jgi:quinolinate synthase